MIANSQKIILKECQEAAVSSLCVKTKELLGTDSQGIRYVFRAPTGSGKMLMCAELLRRLAADQGIAGKCAFVWVDVANLSLRSKEKQIGRAHV